MADILKVSGQMVEYYVKGTQFYTLVSSTHFAAVLLPELVAQVKHNHFKELGMVSAEEKFSHLKLYIEESDVTDLNSNVDSHLLECEGNGAATITRLRQNL